MHLHEAVQQALEKDMLIARKEFIGRGADEYSALEVKLRSTLLMIVICGTTITRTQKFWIPSQDDLLADDWILINPAPEVTRAKKEERR